MKESASSSFCFTFWKKGGLVLEGSNSLPSLWQVSFVRMSPPFACLSEGGVAGFCGDGSRSPGWKRFRQSLFSQWCWWVHMGIGRTILLKVFGLRWRPFWFLLLFLFLGVAFIHFLKRHPLILLCKFTTSGDSQGHTQGLVSTFFSLFLGAAAPISKTTRISLKIIWAISCLFSPSLCWCYFARKI